MICFSMDVSSEERKIVEQTKQKKRINFTEK